MNTERFSIKCRTANRKKHEPKTGRCKDLRCSNTSHQLHLKGYFLVCSQILYYFQSLSRERKQETNKIFDINLQSFMGFCPQYRKLQ